MQGVNQKKQKKQAKREHIKTSLTELYMAVQRLQSEMALLYHLHGKELEDMDKMHEEIAEKVVQKAEEAAKEQLEASQEEVKEEPQLIDNQNQEENIK